MKYLTGKPKIHQFATMIREPNDEEKRLLTEDIRKHGVRVPVVVFDGAVLDGRSRAMTAYGLGIPIPVQEFHGSARNALELVTSYNIYRRHLDPSQKAIAAREIAALLIKLDGMPKKDAIEKAAEVTGASDGYAKEAMRLPKREAEKIKNGKSTIHAFQERRAAERKAAEPPKKPQPVRCPGCGRNLLNLLKHLSAEDVQTLREHLRG